MLQVKGTSDRLSLHFSERQSNGRHERWIPESRLSWLNLSPAPKLTDHAMTFAPIQNHENCEYECLKISTIFIDMHDLLTRSPSRGARLETRTDGRCVHARGVLVWNFKHSMVVCRCTTGFLTAMNVWAGAIRSVGIEVGIPYKTTAVNDPKLAKHQPFHGVHA